MNRKQNQHKIEMCYNTQEFKDRHGIWSGANG